MQIYDIIYLYARIHATFRVKYTLYLIYIKNNFVFSRTFLVINTHLSRKTGSQMYRFSLIVVIFASRKKPMIACEY